MKRSCSNSSHRSPLVVGIVLLLLGALLLAANLGWSVSIVWWQVWPWLMVGGGLIGLIAPSRHITRSGGVWLLAVGVYALVSMHHLWGLNWGTAWPVLVIATGFSILFEQDHKCMKQRVHDEGQVSS